MILISHRGNINGKIPLRENEPSYIKDAIKKGYNVEIDVWWYNNSFYLGHDNPLYKINPEFLQQPELWCHAKNLEAIVEMKKFDAWYLKNIHYFWHQKDDVTLTSRNYIWAYPGKQPIEDSIAVLPEIHKDNLDVCKGICSDYIEKYKQ